VKQNAFTALFIGIIHGFAGFSHLFALLPSLALPSVTDSVIYISAFAAGTIMTMVLFAFILGVVAFKAVVKDKQMFLKWFTLTGGFLAIGIGILWLIHPV
jgi:sulfite exporter TauE/SafE